MANKILDIDYTCRLRDVQVHHFLYLLKYSDFWITNPHSFRPVPTNVTRRNSPNQKGRVQHAWKETIKNVRLLVHLPFYPYFYRLSRHSDMETFNILHNNFLAAIIVPHQSPITFAILSCDRLQLSAENVQIPPIWVLQSPHSKNFFASIHVFQWFHPLSHRVKRILHDVLRIISQWNTPLWRRGFAWSV